LLTPWFQVLSASCDPTVIDSWLDAETKVVTISILETLRDVAESAFEAQQMSWKLFAALTQAKVPVAPSPEGI
jgi:hypothetical protein